MGTNEDIIKPYRYPFGAGHHVSDFLEEEKNISVKMLVKAVIAQFLIAVILVKVPAGRYVVSRVSDAVTSVINCGQDGLSFVFGSLADSTAATGSVFAIQVLGNIVFLSALVSLLYYIGILGFVVKWIGKAVGKLMGTSEVEKLWWRLPTCSWDRPTAPFW